MQSLLTGGTVMLVLLTSMAQAAEQAPAVPAAPLGLRGRVRNAALALRYTLPGRVLYRLTPPRMRERLRRRLR